MGAHRAPAGRDRVGAILHAEGVDGGPVRSEDIPCRHMGVRGFTEQWFRSPYATCSTARWRHGSQLSCAASGVNCVDSHCGSLYPCSGNGNREDAGVESVAGRCGCGAVAAVRQREDAVRVEWKRDW